MGYIDTLTLSVAGIALLISFVSLTRTRKHNREIIELQGATAKYDTKALQVLLDKEKESNTARVSIALRPSGRDHFLFEITNISNAVAYDVEFDILVDNHKDNPIDKSDYHAKFPVLRLDSGKSVWVQSECIAVFRFACNARIKWKNLDGSKSEMTTHLKG